MPEYKEVEWDKRARKGYEVTVSPTGITFYLLNGEYHRTDGPAIIYSNRNKEWFLNGKLHRTDGPAVIRFNGYKAWYLNDKRHRVDGPAVIWADGRKEWFLNNQRLYKRDFTTELILKMNASELFTIQELAKLRLKNA